MAVHHSWPMCGFHRMGKNFRNWWSSPGHKDPCGAINCDRGCYVGGMVVTVIECGRVGPSAAHHSTQRPVLSVVCARQTPGQGSVSPALPVWALTPATRDKQQEKWQATRLKWREFSWRAIHGHLNAAIMPYRGDLGFYGGWQLICDEGEVKVVATMGRFWARGGVRMAKTP